MLTRMKRTIPAVLALSVAFVMLPRAVDAQEQQQQQQQECAVEVTPQQVPAGEAAVSITAQLSEGIGQITALKAEGSGLALASPDDLQPTEMARGEEEGQAPRPVKMAREGNQATVWLSTRDVESGTHPFTLEGENGTCSGELQVAGGQQQPADQEGQQEGR